MRTQNSLKNIKYNLFFFIISGFFAFYSRRVLLQTLGYEIVGIDSLFVNLLGFLNVAELGITSAITFSLYKPIMEKDYNRINSILLTYKYVYRIIAGVITVGVLVLSLFIEKLINGNTVNINTIRFYFILFAAAPITSYLLTYTQVIIYVNQEGYIISRIIGVSRTVKTILQVMLVFYTRSYTVWLILEIIFNVIAFTRINSVIKLKIRWLYLKREKSIKDLIKENWNIFVNTRDLFFHKLAGVVLLQTDNLVISTFTTLKNVTIYSSYIIITNLIVGVFNQVSNGLRPSVGNLIAEKNDCKTYDIWKEIFVFTSLVISVVCYCVYKMINGFIELWIGKEYLLDSFTVLCIVINLAFSLLRQPTDVFKDGYGIFWDKWIPVLESMLNLVISIIMVRKLGIAGVVIGTNISNILTILIWKPYILFKEGFKMSVLKFYAILSKLVLISGLSFYISNQICNYAYQFIIDVNLVNFLLKALLSLVISSTMLIFFSLPVSSFRNIIYKYFGIFIDNVFKSTNKQALKVAP